MYSRILVPLDGSELSVCSLEHVKQVAIPGGASEVILLRVIEPVSRDDAVTWSQAGYSMTDVLNKTKDLAKENLTRAAGKLIDQGISARAEVIEGRAAESIIDFAEKNNIELIIMSTHGRSGISRWTFGSVADRVVRHSPVPVLVISPAECRSGRK
jgi:nucleotide-binding universal stress UspA family protein